MKKLVVILLSSLVILGGCSSTNSNTKNVADQTTKTSNQVFIMAGKIESAGDISVVSKIPAKVTKVAVDVGDIVAKGDPLIYLDTTDMAAQVKQAEAGLKTAKLNLLKVRKGARPEQIATAKAALNAAKTNYDLITANLARLKDAYKNGTVTIQQLETVEGQAASIEAQYKSAQGQLDMINKGETKETFAILQSQVNQAQGGLDYIKALYKNSVITAPETGKINMRYIDAGELAITGQPLLNIVDSNHLFISAYLPPSIANQVEEGQEVIIKVSDLGDKIYKGEISLVSPTVDPRNKNILVKVLIKSEDNNLKPGLIAEVGFNK